MRKPTKKLKDNKLQVLFDEHDAQTQNKLGEQLNVMQKAVSVWLKAVGKVHKVEKWVL